MGARVPSTCASRDARSCSPVPALALRIASLPTLMRAAGPRALRRGHAKGRWRADRRVAPERRSWASARVQVQMASLILAEEAFRHQVSRHLLADVTVQVPQPAELRHRKAHVWHFPVLGADDVHETVEWDGCI
jgi:hypothetical protein